ncbi:WD40 repeat domain-containing protein [Pseudofrankia sp. BMG5.36]|uniref:WD40 repeat domain-containing protein n=1 Tax=Pseudofrankia sp. BMG5.36 TaxID=1834512 RepID=UPI0008DB10C9|nr:WD40 repeat domain-containing protein [Pseudofrankia sp. BMG5.36]OHV44618.1 hypothetical protein BCD48_25610 [Pseudofrankia sp. BMG5.36]
MNDRRAETRVWMRTVHGLVGGIAGGVLLSSAVGTGLWMRDPGRAEAVPSGTVHLNGDVSGLAAFPAAHVMVVCALPGDFRVYDTADPLQISESHRESMPSGRFVADFSPRGDFLAVGVSGGTDIQPALNVWRVSDGEPTGREELPDFKYDVRDTQAVTFSPDGELMITGHKSGKVFAWPTASWPTATGKANTGTRRTLVPFPDDLPATEPVAPSGPVAAMAFVAPRTIVILKEGGETVFLSLAPSGEPDVRHAVVHGTKTSSKTSAIAAAPRPRLLATASDVGDVHLWSSTDSAGILTEFAVLERSGSVSSLTFSADGATLALGTSTGGIELWSVAAPPYRLLRSWEAHHGRVHTVRYLSDRLLASVTDDADVKVWGSL